MGYKFAVAKGDGGKVAEKVEQAESFTVFQVYRGKLTGWEDREPPKMEKSSKSMSIKQAESLVTLIEDCRAVICKSAVQSIRKAFEDNGIVPLITQIGSVDEASRAYMDGYLVGKDPFKSPPGYEI